MFQEEITSLQLFLEDFKQQFELFINESDSIIPKFMDEIDHKK